MITSARNGLVLSAATLLVTAPAAALRHARRLADDALPQPTWTTSTECEIAYYNVCTDWVWVWTSWNRLDRVGVVVDACCDHASLSSTWTYFSGFAHAYGYSTVSIQVVDGSDCPSGLPLAQHVRMPLTGWNFDVWDVPVPSRFAVVQELRTDYGQHPLVYVTTDHPAARGADMPACGTCYPATRATQSYRWGTPSAPLCPGEPFFDGTCNAEILLRAALTCATPVEPRTWAGIKALYR